MRISQLSPLNLAVVVSVISSFLSVLAAHVPAPGISLRNDTLAAGLHAREGGASPWGHAYSVGLGITRIAPRRPRSAVREAALNVGRRLPVHRTAPSVYVVIVLFVATPLTAPLADVCTPLTTAGWMCACLNNNECSARDSTKPICAQSGLCVPACNGQDDCPDPTTYCNVDAGSCLKIQCQSNDDCYSQKPTCYAPQNGTSFCGTNDQCGTDTDCMSKGFLSRNPHCLNPGPNSSCVGCITSSQCVAGNLNTCKSNSCVQCIDSTQCSVGQMCQDNRCKCIDDSGCLPSQQCLFGQCVGFLCT
ncbi:hypothetical protein C8F04DRAFT_1394916, partial [Mycena alexandri]